MLMMANTVTVTDDCHFAKPKDQHSTLLDKQLTELIIPLFTYLCTPPFLVFLLGSVLCYMLNTLIPG